MGEFTDSSVDSSTETETPSTSVPKKRLKLSLRKRSRGKESGDNKENRWQFVDDKREKVLTKKFVPKNTDVSMKWAIANFNNWRDDRNARFEEKVPSDLLNGSDATVLGKWLTLYVAETTKQDGSRYPPKSIYLLLTGILRHMRTLNPICPNFLDMADPCFSSFHAALDNVLHELWSDGVGSKSKEAEIFTKSEEAQLWETGVLSTENPKGLLRAVFFLRGGEEHRLLRISQMTRCMDPLRHVYTENASKNQSCGLVQMHVKNKVVPIIALPQLQGWHKVPCVRT